MALPVRAETLRIATYNVDLSAPGPGLLLHDLRKDPLPPQRAAVVAALVALDADVVVLTGIDYDLRAEALSALADRLAAAGRPYPHRHALRPNTGVPTGRDLDGNGVWARRAMPRAGGALPGKAGWPFCHACRLPKGAAISAGFSGPICRAI